MTIQDDIDAVSSSLDSFVEAKINLTGILTTYINQFNANASRAKLSATLSTYVDQFNTMTTRSNDLRKKVDRLRNQPIALRANNISSLSLGQGARPQLGIVSKSEQLTANSLLISLITTQPQLIINSIPVTVRAIRGDSLASSVNLTTTLPRLTVH